MFGVPDKATSTAWCNVPDHEVVLIVVFVWVLDGCMVQGAFVAVLAAQYIHPKEKSVSMLLQYPGVHFVS